MMARELLGVYLEIFDSLLGHLTDRGYDGVLAQLVLVGHVAPPKQPFRKYSLHTHTATAIPIIYSFPENSAASAPVSTFMCL